MGNVCMIDEMIWEWLWIPNQTSCDNFVYEKYATNMKGKSVEWANSNLMDLWVLNYKSFIDSKFMRKKTSKFLNK